MNDFEQLFNQLPLVAKQNFLNALEIYLAFQNEEKEVFKCNR